MCSCTCKLIFQLHPGKVLLGIARGLLAGVALRQGIPAQTLPLLTVCRQASSKSKKRRSHGPSRSGTSGSGSSSSNSQEATRSQHSALPQTSKAAGLKRHRPKPQQGVQPSSWPNPGRVGLPTNKAPAPELGRVTPTSRAAAAAVAAMLKAAKQSAAADDTTPQGVPASTSPASSTAAGSHSITAGNQAVTGNSHVSSSNGSTASVPEITNAAAPAAFPWEVVQHLPQSSPYTLERMAEMDLAMYIQYMHHARLGMTSVFELGVTREQGRQGRLQLLRRETLLQQALAAAATVQRLTSSRLTGDGLRIDDEQLQGLTMQQLQQASEAADAHCYAAAGATAEEVANCLLDYFVFKRCMQLMLLQRQHRQLMQESYNQWLDQQSQQLQQQHNHQQQHPLGDWQPSNTAAAAAAAEAGNSVGQAAVSSPFSAQELAETDIWDAFIDAELPDYEQYLRAAAAGAPSVFTTMHPNMKIANSMQQQGQQANAAARGADQQQLMQQQRQVLVIADSQQQDQEQRQQNQGRAEAQQQLATTARILSLLPDGMKARPTLLLGGSQVLQVASLAGVAPEDVVEILQDYYRLKRLGFRQALQELMNAADGEQAAQQRLL